jgi:tetratricopeptide (TPR) repeat protein
LQGRADIEASLAGLDVLVGNNTAAISEANEALRVSQTFNVKWNAANALAAGGQAQKALALADEIQRERPNDTIAQNVAVPMIRAIVALNLSTPSKADPTKAIDLENTAALYGRANTGVLFVRGKAYFLAGRLTEAEQDFQKVVDFKAQGPDTIMAVSQLELGRVYQKQGDLAKARIAYQNLLAAWKDADPDVPLLKIARAEYAKLQ